MSQVNKDLFFAQYGHEGHITSAIKNPDRFVRAKAAMSPHLTDAHIDALGRDSRDYVRRELYSNPILSHKQISDGMKTNNDDILLGITKNPSTSVEHLTTLSNHEDFDIASRAKQALSKIKHSQLSAEDFANSK